MHRDLRDSECDDGGDKPMSGLGPMRRAVEEHEEGLVDVVVKQVRGLPVNQKTGSAASDQC